MVGTRIAHYDITAKLGQGGMGEVYRARDSKLGREVAVKVLPESFAGNKERLARFEREAKTLATLNHPNVAGIYGLEQSGNSQALVLELVEGEDLSERLLRGALAVEEALEVGKQIAEALEAAHEKGIVHRDLKPGNIKFDADGRVKVLDFGLAKALAEESGSVGRAYSQAELGEGDGSGGRSLHHGMAEDESPTITDAYTQPGTILGTAGYMSPEQARGKQLDKRSDIWAFGCVLFECLTGERAFVGEDTSEILAGIIKGDPRWSALPAGVPPTIEGLLRKCLTKDRKRRLHDVADARIDIEAVLSGELAAEPSVKRGIHPLIAVAGIGLAVVVTVVLMWALKQNEVADDSLAESDSASRNRLIPMFIGMEGSLSRANGAAARLSPDGSTLGFLFSPTGSRSHRRIHLRRFDRLETTILDSSRGAIDFRFSPGGEWVVFRVEGGNELKKAAVNAGGPFQVICRTEHGRGMDWADDGWIVYSHSSSGGLYRVLASGEGQPEQITHVSGDDVTHRWPNVLPGGTAVVFTAHTEKSYGYDDAKVMVQELPHGEPRVFAKGFQGRYLPSGHLVYVRRNTLFARAFDLASLESIGPEIPVVQDVATGKNGVAHYDVSPGGDLVYLKGGYLQQLYMLEWYDRDGNRETVPYVDAFLHYRVSPDGRFLASAVDKGDRKQIWIYDLERKNPVQLTFDDTEDNHPVWSPTGGAIVFSRKKTDGSRNLYWVRTDASGPPERLLESDAGQIPHSWSRDGRFLAITEQVKGRPMDIRIVQLEGNDARGWSYVDINDFRVSEFWEDHPQFSPNGRWIAYASNETGTRNLAFVRAFPEGGDRQQVSTVAEGDVWWLRWSQQRDELFFGNLYCYSAPYSQHEERFNAETPVQWAGVQADDVFNQAQRSYESFDVDPDGLRVLVRKQAQDEAMDETRSHIVLFENFLDYLREKVPVSLEP